MATSSTTIDEIAQDIYRVSSPVQIPGGGFSFNQYLVLDDQPLLFHTGPRRMFPLTRDAIAKVLDPAKLRYLALSHFEADECGALNDFLAIAPQSVPVCSTVAALTSINDVADRPPQPLGLMGRSCRWQARAALVRHAPFTARLGVRLPVRHDQPDPVLRRPVHAAGRQYAAAH